MTTTGGGNLAWARAPASHDLHLRQPKHQLENSKSFTSSDPGPVNELLHLDDPNPVLINISGSVSDITLTPRSRLKCM